MTYKLSILSLTTFALCSAAHAAPVYLNSNNMSVSVGAGTGVGSSNNTFANGQTIDKVIDAATAETEEFHNQTTHIWYSFTDPTDGLELIFDFDQSYDISTLHFWNYDGEFFDVDQVDFSFFDELGALLGTQTLLPALGTSPAITAQDISLVSPLNVSSVSAFLTGSNGQIDFQNIGFTADISAPPIGAVPLPASSLMLVAGLVGLGSMRRRSKPRL